MAFPAAGFPDADPVRRWIKGEAMPADNKHNNSIQGLEIFATGKWNGDPYSADDLDEMVRAFGAVGFKPPLKLGHSEKQKILKGEGLPAAGWVDSIYRKGKKLLADVRDIPDTIYQLIKSRAYDRVSAEIYWNYTDSESGKKFPRVLRAIALLGQDIPEVTNLKAISEMFDEHGMAYRTYIVHPDDDDEHGVLKLKEHIVEKRGDQWVLISKTTGDVLGTHDTKEQALAQEAAIKARQANMQSMGPMMVVGRLKGATTTTTQSLIFPKEHFDRVAAMNWAKEHGFKSGDVDETESSFRLRQRNPGEFMPGSFRTIEPGKDKTKGDNKMGKEETETKLAELESSISEKDKEIEGMKAKLAEYEKGHSGKELATKLAELEKKAQTEREARMELEEQLKEFRALRRSEQIKQSVGKYVQDKKITPAQRPLIEALLEKLPDEDIVVMYSKDGMKPEEMKLAPSEIVKRFMDIQANGIRTQEETVDGIPADESEDAVDARVRAYCKENSLNYNKSDDYKQALFAVRQGRAV